MDINLARKAVNLAINGRWAEAIQSNLLILKENPEDVDCLNRLARAYAELGDYVKAKSFLKKVTDLDPHNKIANKSMQKWKDLKKGDAITSGPTSAEAFLEEPGKTKILTLMHICSSEVLSILDPGDEVKINTHGHRITITTVDGKYIGKLPDDLSAHLRNLIKYGNVYTAIIKSSDKHEVKVFIKEIKRSEKLKDIASFSTEKMDYVSFTPPELVHDKTEIIKEGEDEEI